MKEKEKEKSKVKRNNNYKIKTTKYLLTTNIFFTLAIILGDTLACFVSNSNKNIFFIAILCINIFLFFLYKFRITSLISKNWFAIKKEIMYINYPFTIGFIMLAFISVLIGSIIAIACVNKNAVNLTFASTLFIHTIGILLPSFLLLIYMYLLTPAYVIPSYETKKNKVSDKFLYLFFSIFIILSIGKVIFDAISSVNLGNKDKYKVAKMSFAANRNFLNYSDLSEETINKLKERKHEVPYIYTVNGIKIKNYDEAERFCASLNARVANHLEVYNIVFNRFDMFGENYYWTSEKAGITPILLHFKDMRYELIKDTLEVTPTLHCTAQISENNEYEIPNYLYKNTLEEEGTMKKKQPLIPFLRDKLNNAEKISKKHLEGIIPAMELENNSKNKGYINFRVRQVSPQYLQRLIEEGYNYDINEKPNSQFVQSYNISSLKPIDGREVRLCDFPYIEYKRLPQFAEDQIWGQNFCRPKYKIAEVQPAYKTMHEKDYFCSANGGRLPNITELNSILKLKNVNTSGYTFWTNMTVNDYYNNISAPIVIKYLNDNVVEPIAMLDENETATALCVKDVQNKSSIIANFKPRNKNQNGQIKAKMLCVDCEYAEMQDTMIGY